MISLIYSWAAGSEYACMPKPRSPIFGPGLGVVIFCTPGNQGLAKLTCRRVYLFPRVKLEVSIRVKIRATEN